MNDSSNIKLCECGCGEPAPIAKHSYRNIRKGEPTKFIAGHQRRKSPVAYTEEDRGYDTPCWIWQRYINNAGYPRVRIKGKQLAAHRVYYEAEHGGLGPEEEVHHLCSTKPCVRPSHLMAVVRADHNHLERPAKLTANEVEEIRDLYKGGGYTYLALAERFDVSKSAVQHIVQRRTWTNN